MHTAYKFFVVLFVLALLRIAASAQPALRQNIPVKVAG